MAIMFNVLLPEKVYRTNQKFTLPFGIKTKDKGNLVTVLSQNLDDTLNFFKSPYIAMTNYRRYYLDRTKKYTILGQSTIVKNKTKEVIDLHLDPSGLQLTLLTTTTQVRDYNIIYELGQYDELVNMNKRLATKNAQARGIIETDMLRSRLMDIDDLMSHPNKYLYIPVDKYIENPKDSTIFTNKVNRDNPVVQIWYDILNDPTRFASLDNWSLVFVNKNELFYIKCKDINADTAKSIQLLFKQFKNKQGKETVLEDDTVNKSETSVEEENRKQAEQTETIKKSNIKAVLNDVIADKSDGINLSEKAIKNISDKVDEVQQKDKVVTDHKDTESIDKLLNHNEVKEAINKELEEIMNPASKARIAREKKMKDELSKIKIQDKTIEQIHLEAKQKAITPKVIKANVINEDMKKIKFQNFDKEYNAKLLESDIVDTLTCFGEKDRPLHLIKITKEDTSTTIDKIITYTCIYEDEKGRRHTLTFDIPKFMDDKFIHLNKSDKIFITQQITLPITKTAPDTVQVASNYNKIFITRFGQNLSPKISKFHKALPDLDFNILKSVKGNSTKSNAKFMTTLEYDELASKYMTISLHRGEIVIYLNQNEIRELCTSYNMIYDNSKQLPYAIDYSNKNNLKLITIDIDKDKITGTDLSPIDYIISEVETDKPGFKDEFIKLGSGKRFIYTRAKIMSKYVPLGFLLAFLDGIEPLLIKAKINYQFTETRPVLRGDDAINKGIIAFNDGYLVYDQYPFGNSLLLNGFSEIPTKEFNFMEFNGKDIYFKLFDMLYGRRNIGTAFENFQQLFVDPITKQILESYNLPTEFVSIMIYANSLLENNANSSDGSLYNYRFRTNEMVVAHLYKILASAYESYRATADNRNPQKFTVRRNAVISDMMESQVLEEYSSINPIFEAERMRSTSPKGAGGRNLARAFKLESRSYNDTMMGVYAQSSPISANIGVSRTLSLDPNITSLRGDIRPGDPDHLDELKSTNIASPAELLLPSTVTKDDSQRVSMASIQSRHTVSSLDSDVPLYGTGFDRVLAHTISNRFAFKTKSDGVIKEINEKLGFMILQYDDGTTDVVDLRTKQEKNAGKPLPHMVAMPCCKLS